MPNQVVPYTPIVGVDQQGWCTLETTFDTNIPITSAMAFGYIEMHFTDTEDYNEIFEAQGTAGLTSEVKGMRHGKWECKVNMKTAALGTLLNYHPLLRAVYLAHTVVGGTSVAYGPFGEAQSMPQTLQLTKYAGFGWWEQINGAIVQKFEAGCDEGGKVSWFKFSGEYTSYARVQGEAVTQNAISAIGQPVVVMSAASAKKILQRGGSFPLLAFGAENNAGAGYQAQSIAADSITMTLSSNLLANVPANTPIQAFVPAWANAGNIVGGISNQLTIGATNINMIGFNLSVETGYKLSMRESTTNRPRFAYRTRRKINAKLTAFVLDENTGLFGTAWSDVLTGVVNTIAVRLGSATAASRWIFNITSGRFKSNAVKLTDAEAATYAIETVGRFTSAGGDELNQIAN